MRLKIRSILLWPKDHSKQVRPVDLSGPGVVVVTGQSRSGKSSLTWITDYCLGSSRCSIPVGLIREKTEWFGLHMELAGREMLVARPEPSGPEAESAVCLLTGATIDVPTLPQVNADLDFLKHVLNEEAGLPALDLDPTREGLPFRERPSFRDMVSFNFQPQHVVANPYSLFYKADSASHRQKLIAVFPLALGVVDPAHLEAQHMLSEAQRELAKRERELALWEEAVERWRTEVRAFYLQAVELGLLEGDGGPREDWPTERYIAELRKAADKTKRLGLPSAAEGSTEAAIGALSAIVREEERLAHEIGMRRLRLQRIAQLNESARGYGDDLARQEDRTSGSSWFRDRIHGATRCPLCGAQTGRSRAVVDAVIAAADELSNLSRSVDQVPAVLDKERSQLAAELRKLEQALALCRTQRQALEDESEAVAAHRRRLEEAYRLAGRIEQAMADLDAMSGPDGLAEQISILKEQVAALQLQVDAKAAKQRRDAALNRVAHGIGEYATKLQLERAGDPLKLDVDNLTLRLQATGGRWDYLWEVGSAENWMGYHVAALLGLHAHLLSLERSPVATFILLDQPSQAYFPEGVPENEDELARYLERRPSADIEGVRRVFRALSAAADQAAGNLQIIVTEHAGEFAWRGLDNVHVSENWHGDPGEVDFLIPRDWLTGD